MRLDINRNKNPQGIDMIMDLFGKPIGNSDEIHINIYADEIQPVRSKVTGEEWMYSASIYEKIKSPILNDLIDERYRKDLTNWESYRLQNDSDIHWATINNDNNKKNIIIRWINYILKDCSPRHRKFYFSIFGLNLTNLTTDEFGNHQQFNNIYNRFFRSMLQYSLKKFYSHGIIVDHIYHEGGQQSKHEYFNWYTIFKLDKDEKLNFACNSVEYLPKSHRDDERSNIIQLCDVLVGGFKDIHLGVNTNTYPINKKEMLSSNFIQELLIKRIIKAPHNKNSSYGYSNRFNISLFPKRKSDPGSILRSLDNYYDISKIKLGYEYNSEQSTLF